MYDIVCGRLNKVNQLHDGNVDTDCLKSVFSVYVASMVSAPDV